MFCGSLRRRLSVSKIIPDLLAPNGLALTERALDTHDLSIPCPAHGSSEASGHKGRQLRFLILTISSVSPSKLGDTLQRIERLSAQHGGSDIVIVFILQASTVVAKQHQSKLYPSPDTSISTEGSHAYSRLQVGLFERELARSIPILLVARLSSLVDTIKTHMTTADLPSPKAPSTPTSLDLLASCAVGSRMPQFAIDVTSDCFRSLRHLAIEASQTRMRTDQPDLNLSDGKIIPWSDTGDDEVDQISGRINILVEQLGQEAVSAIVDFWLDEYAAD